MKARDAEIAREQRQIAAKMQAALFQRDILAHAGEERIRQATRPRRVLRRRPGRRPPTAATGAPPRVPRQGTPPPGPPEDLPPSPPRGRPRWLDADDPEHPPEASSREVQNIPLGLGALLLGVAAVVFAAVATSSMDALARLGVLLVATALMLLAPPVLARRGLTSTAETIAAVGLLLVPLAGYALWAVDRIGGGSSGAAFAGIDLPGHHARRPGVRVRDRSARATLRHRAGRPAGAAAAGVRADHRAGRLGAGAHRGGRARPRARPLGGGTRAAGPA